jgi:hypothetical protein
VAGSRAGCNWRCPARAVLRADRQRPELVEREQLVGNLVSWMVWIAVTSSERLFAPTAILPLSKDRDANDDRRLIVHYWHELERGSGPHCQRLTEIIHRCTEQTIAADDERCQLAPKVPTRTESQCDTRSHAGSGSTDWRVE